MVLNLANCSTCGAPVPNDARTLGLCPRCLMRSALGAAGGRAAPMIEPPDADALRDELPPDLESLDLIGRGGMGFVYRARQRSLDRLVAVKLFPRDTFEDPSFAERFAAEARILASFNHPNIVGAYAFGESERYCHLVMELVPGRSLRDRLERGPLPVDEALAVARQVVAALAYAHARGVVHRDVKPENILLEEADGGGGGAPRVRVADFGLAKLLGRGAADFAMTAPDRLMGTPDYMAPEQRTAPGEVDARADVYALGVVLYEMLTGRLPLGRFVPPTGDRGLDRVVLRCLEPRPADRFASVAEVGRALEARAARRQEWVVPAALLAAGLVMMGGVVIVGPMTEAKRAPEPLLSATTAPVRPATNRVAAARAPDPAQQTGPVPPPVFRPREFGPPAFATQGFGPPAYPSRAEMLERMTREHGTHRVVTVIVDALRPDARAWAIDRVRELSGASASSSSGSLTSATIHLAPVRDPAALAKKIDFGNATADPAKRVIEVVADPAKLPPPLPPAVTDAKAADFYAQNLADLGSWNKARQVEAAKRLAAAPPIERRAEIAAALEKLSDQPDREVQRAAREAMGRWDGEGAIAALVDLLSTDDARTRGAAIRSLATTGEIAAAEAIAGAMDQNRDDAGAALRTMGPVAEGPALAVLRRAPAVESRVEAAKVLGAVGTGKSLAALAEAAASKEAPLAAAAKDAIAAIKGRGN